MIILWVQGMHLLNTLILKGCGIVTENAWVHLDCLHILLGQDHSHLIWSDQVTGAARWVWGHAHSPFPSRKFWNLVDMRLLLVFRPKCSIIPGVLCMAGKKCLGMRLAKPIATSRRQYSRVTQHENLLPFLSIVIPMLRRGGEMGVCNQSIYSA